MFAHYTISGTTPTGNTGAVLGTVGPDTAYTFVDSNLSDYDTVDVCGRIAGATGGTLDVIIERSYDGGTSWVEYATFAQLAAAASAVVKVMTASLSDSVRTVGRVTSATSTARTLSGDNAPMGAPGDRLRVRVVSGTGTTVGASIAVDLTFRASRQPTH